MELVKDGTSSFHDSCFKCFQCKAKLRPGKYSKLIPTGKFYCELHFQQAYNATVNKPQEEPVNSIQPIHTPPVIRPQPVHNTTVITTPNHSTVGPNVNILDILLNQPSIHTGTSKKPPRKKIEPKYPNLKIPFGMYHYNIFKYKISYLYSTILR
jgi:hypothetical protein